MPRHNKNNNHQKGAPVLPPCKWESLAAEAASISCRRACDASGGDLCIKVGRVTIMNPTSLAVASDVFRKQIEGGVLVLGSGVQVEFTPANIEFLRTGEAKPTFLTRYVDNLLTRRLLHLCPVAPKHYHQVLGLMVQAAAGKPAEVPASVAAAAAQAPQGKYCARHLADALETPMDVELPFAEVAQHLRYAASGGSRGSPASCFEPSLLAMLGAGYAAAVTARVGHANGKFTLTITEARTQKKLELPRALRVTMLGCPGCTPGTLSLAWVLAKSKEASQDPNISGAQLQRLHNMGGKTRDPEALQKILDDVADFRSFLLRAFNVSGGDASTQTLRLSDALLDSPKMLKLVNEECLADIATGKAAAAIKKVKDARSN